MNLRLLLISLIAALTLTACGGASGSKSKGPSSYEQLSSISGELQGKLDETAAPVTQTDAMIARFTELPKTLKLSTEDYKEFVIYALRGEFKAPEGASEEVTKELTAFSQELKTYKEQLFATPDNATALASELAGALTKVPTLVTKIEGEAQVVKANPLASKAEKAKADKQSTEAKTLGAQTTDKVKEIQTKVTELPAQATSAIAKFTEALKAVGIDNLDAAKSAPSDVAKGAVKDAKDAADQVVETAKDSAQDSVDAAKSVTE
jgi:hypothetical protein